MRLFSNRKRSVPMGPYPLERLARTDVITEPPRGGERRALDLGDAGDARNLRAAMADYLDLFDRLRDGKRSPAHAPIPEDPRRRAENLKGCAYFLDASQVGICRIPHSALLDAAADPPSARAARERRMATGATANVMMAYSIARGDEAWKRQDEVATAMRGHDFAIAILVGHTPEPRSGDPGKEWICGSQAARAAVRAAEVAGVLAGYLRTLGFAGRAHTATASDLDPDAILLASGLAEVVGGEVRNPYLGTAFGCAIVSTDMEVEVDRPLAPRGVFALWRAHGPAWWLGLDGTKPGWKRLSGATRPLHLGPHPMERIRRVDRPTTRVDEENVPRVPKRHDAFVRAAHGDLGERAKREMDHFRFVTKEPFAANMQPLLGGMVPLQSGEAAAERAPGLDDPKRNSDAVKSLCYYLGADMTGVGPAKPYCWYSHDRDSTPIEPYHPNAIVVLLDQGFETMEGAATTGSAPRSRCGPTCAARS